MNRIRIFSIIIILLLSIAPTGIVSSTYANKKPKSTRIKRSARPTIKNRFNTKSIRGVPRTEFNRKAIRSITNNDIIRRGSTGRNTPRNIKESRILKEFKRKPLSNVGLISKKLKDPRYKGWSKYKVNNTNIHFLRKYQNGRYLYADIKFKNKPGKLKWFKDKKTGKLVRKSLSNTFNSKKNMVGSSPLAQFYQVRGNKKQTN